MRDPFPAGKLPPEILEGLLRKLPNRDPRVVVGPRVGEDAAVIDMGDRYLVAKTDPITFAADRIGWYLVHINANDIACMGAQPKWLLVTCLLPEKETDAGLVDSLFQDLDQACEELGVTLCGGHTEITLGLDRPILVGQLLGEVPKDRLVDKRRISPGDSILLTKGIAVEGTCVIARERGVFLEGRIPPEVMKRARNLLTEPGISVLRDARIAMHACGGQVHGMHDPTEGGLQQGLWEVAEGAGAGIRVQREAVPLLPETQALCKVFGIDPMGLLASGSLLIMVDPAGEKRVEEALQSEGVPCRRIGEILPAEEGRKWLEKGKPYPLSPVPADELIKAFQEGP